MVKCQGSLAGRFVEGKAPVMLNINFLHLTRDLRITLVLGLTSRSMKSSSARNIVQYDLLVGYG